MTVPEVAKLTGGSRGLKVVIEADLWLREALSEEVEFVVAASTVKYLSLRHDGAQHAPLKKASQRLILQHSRYQLNVNISDS